MMSRSNLSEQLNDWPPSAFSSSVFSPASSSSSRVDVVLVMWDILMFACLVFTGVSLYFRYLKFAFFLLLVTIVFLICMKITKQVRQNRKSMRRLLLPLSM
ncbi:uncharacterized protein LOC122047636 [Zingiber officinale]|uniref:Uncharacterized protein n=1 Tax=Zingiber officinale TaxID=94328 RepID=A0A8J5HEE1_ZINOF|nr:uncharacterized protein LOC122047636 [Zingiber officinale]KAG6526431.1 hypothetical protein ZIOFF_016415 [Zingiber officinale]